MSKLNWAPFTKGSLLRPEVQREALARFINRHTRDHKPAWSRNGWKDKEGNKGPYPVQFASDDEWLSCTVFKTNRDGTLSDRVTHCESSPTWPDNPELRK